MKDFDARWAAWQRRGKAHDRLIARRFMIAIPVMGIVAALAFAFYYFR